MSEVTEPTTWDVVVVGAGPAGLAAAGTAARLGAHVLLLDEQRVPGGQIYRNITCASARQRAIMGADYAHGAYLLAAIKEPRLHYQPGATVWQITGDKEVFYSAEGRSTQVLARQLIVATGALERPMPFAGWTLPGVMTAGAMQTLLKGAMVPSGRLVLAGSGPLLLLLALQLHRAGAHVARIVDTTPRRNAWRAAAYLPGALRGYDYLLKGGRILRELEQTGIARALYAEGLGANGNEAGVSEVRYRTRGQWYTQACDLLLVHQGVVPNVQISRALRAEHNWDPVGRYWRPVLDSTCQCTLPDIAFAGDGAGIGGALAAAYQGEIAACGALARLGIDAQGATEKLLRTARLAYSRHLAVRPWLEALFAPASEFLAPSDDVMVCRCEEVTAGTVRHLARTGCVGPNQLKAFSRAGMGPCQGRYCGSTVCELLAEVHENTPAEVGYYRLRNPVKPVTVADLANID